MPSFFEEVDGVRIHYEKVGTGSQVLLLIPGAIGKREAASVERMHQSRQANKS